MASAMRFSTAASINGTFNGTAPNVVRVAGSTTVTGTALNSSGGAYMVKMKI